MIRSVDDAVLFIKLMKGLSEPSIVTKLMQQISEDYMNDTLRLSRITFTGEGEMEIAEQLYFKAPFDMEVFYYLYEQYSKSNDYEYKVQKILDQFLITLEYNEGNNKCWRYFRSFIFEHREQVNTYLKQKEEYGEYIIALFSKCLIFQRKALGRLDSPKSTEKLIKQLETQNECALMIETGTGHFTEKFSNVLEYLYTI